MATEFDMASNVATDARSRRGALLFLPKNAEASKKLEQVQQRADSNFLWRGYLSSVVHCSQDDVSEILNFGNSSVATPHVVSPLVDSDSSNNI